MSRETIAPQQAAGLLARTAEYVSSIAATHICDSAQVLWSDAQSGPAALVYLATPHERMPEQKQPPIEQRLDFPEGKLFTTCYPGGGPLLETTGRPTATEALHCLGSLVSGMATDCPLEIYRACISSADAYTVEKTRLTVEAALPETPAQIQQLNNFLDSHGGVPSDFGHHSLLLEHQGIGKPSRSYAAQLCLYPLNA